MTNTTQLFGLAQLAEASYAEFNLFGTMEDALKNKNFSPTQAAEFTKNWKVISHQPNTGNGYSGTLFEYIGTDTDSGFTQGQQIFAQRGTEPTDLGDVSAEENKWGQTRLISFFGLPTPFEEVCLFANNSIS